MCIDESDAYFMGKAIKLGQRALGTTQENPAVGCLIVEEKKDNRRQRILAGAHTAEGGRPHAEICALQRIAGKTKGATLYVSLEPCAHTGLSSPCANAIINAGIKRVVSALEDPDERVRGKGHQMIRDAGIDLTTDIEREKALYAHRGFLSRKIKKRPYVTLKLALSKDGKIAAEKNTRTQITSECAQRYVHKIRAQNDAVMIGRKTAEIDQPQLTCRLTGLEKFSPIRIIMDTHAQSSRHIPIKNNDKHAPPIWIMHANDTIKDEDGDKNGITIISLTPDENGTVSINEALIYLAQQGINHLLVEGGSVLGAAFIKADAIDEVIFLSAPHEIGREGVGALNNMSLETITNSPLYQCIEQIKLGPDTCTRYIRNKESHHLCLPELLQR